MQQHSLDAIIAGTNGPAWSIDWVNGDNFSGSSSSPAAISGYPNICVPMGYVHGLPVGISFFGRAWSEPVLIRLAYAYEQASKHRKAPKFWLLCFKVLRGVKNFFELGNSKTRELNILWPVFQLDIVYKLPDLLFVFAAAHQQSVVGFYHNVSIKSLKNCDFVARHINNAVFVVV
jgi:hypothetical protein